MYYSCNFKQAHDADRRAVKEGTPVRVLMERAGEALAETVSAAMERLGLCDVLFVCGGGNNGGDGFVAARILSEQGKDVQLLCLAEKFSSDCARAKMRFKGDLLARIPRRRYKLVVDCVLGTGLTRAPEGDAAKLIAFINSCGAYVIACDLPSGLADNGIALSPCVRADETLSIGVMKNALLLLDGPDKAGSVRVADIGFSPDPSYAEVKEQEDIAVYFPKRRSNVNKGTFGKACILSCGNRIGAAVLSVKACLRSGCGYTFLRVPEEARFSLAAQIPDCITGGLNGIDEEILGADALAVGMGAGVTRELYDLTVQLLGKYTGTLILDADALTALASYGLQPLKNKACEVILTPHPKEFSRLTNKSVKEVLEDPLTSAAAFAKEYGITLILKNNRSVITDGERIAINTTGSPALAKGGSGDVLTGLLTGTCARGVAPYEAACACSYLLGKAGEIAGFELGEYASTSSDVIEKIPAAILSLRKQREKSAEESILIKS